MKCRSVASVLCAALLAGCGFDHAPEGYESVDPPYPRNQYDQCPDLGGSYAISADDAALFLDRSKPENQGYTMYLSIPQDASGSGSAVRAAYWTMDRKTFLDFAREFRERDSDGYDRWRRLILREHLPSDLASDNGKWIAAVHRHGPIFSLGAGLVVRGCDSNWAMVRSELQPGWKHEEELWLGRNRDGALLFKTVVYDVKTYRFWGDSTSFLRTGANHRWRKIPAAAPIDSTALTAADLPPPLTRTERLRSCGDPTLHLTEANKALLIALPYGASIESFSPRTHGRSPDHYLCRALSVDVSVRLVKASDLPALKQAIEQAPKLGMVHVRQRSIDDGAMIVAFSLVVEMK
jgi:hypothetical protein